MLNDLNGKFNDFGVFFEQVVVMSIIIPGQLRYCQQSTTAYDVHLQNQIKKHENFMIKLENTENKTLATLRKENQRILVDLRHQKEVSIVDTEEKQIRAETA